MKQSRANPGHLGNQCAILAAEVLLDIVPDQFRHDGGLAVGGNGNLQLPLLVDGRVIEGAQGRIVYDVHRDIDPPGFLVDQAVGRLMIRGRHHQDLPVHVARFIGSFQQVDLLGIGQCLNRLIRLLRNNGYPGMALEQPLDLCLGHLTASHHQALLAVKLQEYGEQRIHRWATCCQVSSISCG